MREFVILTATILLVPMAGMASTTHETELVTTTASGDQLVGGHYLEAVTPDGNTVLFSSGEPFVPADTNDRTDLYVKNMTTGAVELVTLGSDGSQPTNATGGGSIDASGTRVAFYSDSPLVDDDNNSVRDIFVRDLVANTTSRVSVSTGGTDGNADADSAEISLDGNVVAFHSRAGNLVLGDLNDRTDVFVRDLSLGVTERVSITTDGLEANGFSHVRAVSGDGEVVLFYSEATNLDDTTSMLFVHDRATGSTMGVPAPQHGVVSGADLTADGERVSLLTVDVSMLGSGAAFSVWEFDLAQETLTAISRFPVPSNYFDALPSNPGPDGFWYAGFSRDGRRVAFSPGFIRAPGEVAGSWKPPLYVHDLATRETITVTLQADGSLGSVDVAKTLLSDDGLTVVFQSQSNDLVPIDLNPAWDVFRSDLPRSPFSDTGSTSFRRDILWLAGEEITRGCSPVAFCPDDPVTRGQMAAFITRALGLASEPGSNTFTDDDGTIFETDIEALAAAGITRGCNPDGTLFCPDGFVTRGQMAAFLHRALDPLELTG